MPKQKTKSSAKKRVKLTGTGQLRRRHAMKSHNLAKKSAKRKREFAKDQLISPVDERRVKRLLGR